MKDISATFMNNTSTRNRSRGEKPPLRRTAHIRRRKSRYPPHYFSLDSIKSRTSQNLLAESKNLKNKEKRKELHSISNIDWY
jgi:hypothetical protein